MKKNLKDIDIFFAFDSDHIDEENLNRALHVVPHHKLDAGQKWDASVEQLILPMTVSVEDAGKHILLLRKYFASRAHRDMYQGSVLISSILAAECKTAVKTKVSAAPHIELPPGVRLMSFARFLFSGKTIEQVFEPLIADYQHEVFDAMAAGASESCIRAIRARNFIGFVVAVLLVGLGGIGRIVRALKGN